MLRECKLILTSNISLYYYTILFYLHLINNLFITIYNFIINNDNPLLDIFY